MKLSLPTKKQVLKGTLGVLGAIIVGALGSGVWQSLLGPALHSSTRWVLDIASLGFRSYKDGVYQQIAADNQSAVALLTLSWITGVSGLMLGAVCGYTTGVLEGMRSGIRDALKGLSEKLSDPEPASEVGMLKQKLEAELMSLRVKRWVMNIALSGAVILFVTHVVSVARISYVNSASTHYHQVLRVASPYLDAHEQAEAESDFAQVSSREDYVRLLSRLEGQCKAHGKTVPTFDPW